MQVLVLPPHRVVCVRDNEVLQTLPVSVGVVQNAVCKATVSASSANFLRVILQTFRQSSMHDKPDVTLVDAHAEGNRRDNYMDIVSHPTKLHVLPRRIAHLGVVEVTLDFVFR